MKWWWFAWIILWGVPAKAQLTTLREHARQLDSGRFAAGLELGSYFGEVESSGYALFAPTGLASLRVREAVLELAAPFAYFHEHNEPGSDHSQFGVGNPWLGLSYLPDTSCGLARLSLGVAAPLASDSGGRAARALSLARATQGASDGYLFEGGLFPLVLGGGTLKDVGFIRLLWDGDVIFGLPAGDRDVELGLQSAGELMLRFAWHTSFSTRASVAYYPTFSGDRAQTAAALVFRHTMTDSDSFGARFVVNLDEPLGFSFAEDGIWGLSLFYLAAY